jgi:hypothetical protein
MTLEFAIGPESIIIIIITKVKGKVPLVAGLMVEY